MSNEVIALLTLIIIILSFFINRERKQRLLIKKTLSSLEEILEGNKNLKILVGENEQIAPLIFKVNQLVESYQLDKVKMNRTIQERKELMSNLSHDVRTPLTSILGYLDAICNGIAGDETLEYIHVVKDKAYALKHYIDELFTIAQLDANEIQLKQEKIDLLELIRNELIAWVPQIQKENITYDINIPDEEIFIMGDEHALVRILNNLLQNAFRYGGDFIGVKIWNDEINVHFEVWDKGAGIKEEEIKKVFNRLYKCDYSRTTKGHGLGLAISKELVEKMNGCIHMESNPYKKTCVQVSLPICKKK